MLSYALAIVVAISSLVLFSTAFLMSKIHRRDDFLWSAVGLFYALVLWYCARNITGAVLLGQAAATALLVSYNWQTIKLRRMIADPAQAAAANNFSVLNSINGFWKRKKPQKQPAEVAPAPVAKPPMPTVTEEIAIPKTPTEAPEVTPVETSDVTPTTPTEDTLDKTNRVAEAVSPQVNLPSDTKVTPPQAEDKTPEIKPTAPTIDTSDKTDRVAEAVSPQVNLPSDTKVTAPQAKAEDKTAQTNPNTNLPRVREPAIEAKIDANVSKPLVDIEIIDKATSDSEDIKSDRVSQQPISTPQSLPNKLPKAVDTDEVKPSLPETEIDKEFSETIDNEPIAPLPSEESKVEAKPASPFDSLETVEVAEVLEAESDREFNRRGDRSDEIEVTTTDVDIAENTKKDRNQQGESDLNDV